MSPEEHTHRALLDAEAQHKEKFGHWNEELRRLFLRDQEYFSAYEALLDVPRDRGNLTHGEQELIYIAVNSAITHFNSDATRDHIYRAQQLGVSDQYIEETIQLSASLGVHSVLVGMPMLKEILASIGENDRPDLQHKEKPDPHETNRSAELKTQFQEERKYWSDSWDSVLEFAPEYFEAYLALSRLPWVNGCLSDGFRELVYIAIDVSTTHLFTSGIRTHIRKALEYGIATDKIIDAILIASNIGMQTTLMATSHIGHSNNQSSRNDQPDKTPSMADAEAQCCWKQEAQ